MPNAPYTGDCLDQACANLSGIMHIVRSGLVTRGFQIEALTSDDSYGLSIASPAWSRCELTIEDDGAVRWEAKPAAGHDSDPQLFTQLALRMLAVNRTCIAGLELSMPSDVTLKSVVGRALDTCGLEVRLAVYEDTACYEVEAHIVVANPQRPERGCVRLSDNADFVWEWSCRDAPPGGTSSIAKMIVRVLADATDLAKLH